MSFSIIVPSRTASNILACKTSIFEKESPRVPQIRVPWDAETHASLGLWEPCEPEPRFYRTQKPFIFARNVNLGITAALAAGDDAVVIVNDDTRLLERFGYSWLVRHALDHPEYGVISAGLTGAVGNREQIKLPGTRLRAIAGKSLAFVAVCITLVTIDKVGMLDERFTAYGWEDNDYCLRCRQAGLKLGVFDGCHVEHGVLPSTFRPGNKAGDIEPGRKQFIEKWGSDQL